MGRSIPAVVRQGTLCSISKENLIMAKKKGFMTPERKKKLRTLLRKKAAEELKKEQERKAEERLRVIAERCGTKADLENTSTDELKKICQQYFDKWYSLEGEVILRDLQINELTISVSDMKGKFIKPTPRKCPSTRTSSPNCRRRPPNSPSPTSSRLSKRASLSELRKTSPDLLNRATGLKIVRSICHHR